MSQKSSESISKEDLEILRTQLRREPRRVIAIETRCPAGHPQVIRVHPLVDEKPFPTLFWLSCPALIAQISRIEHQGYIQKLETILSEDSELLAAYHQNHQKYIEERWSHLSEEEIELLESKNYTEVLRDYGIGGIRDWNTIKCLHLQYAQHLAMGNVIGEWIDQNFQISFCEDSVSDASGSSES